MDPKYEDFKYADGATYPTDVPTRYELRNGKFGPYFHDTRASGYDMPLSEVLNTLNRYALRKSQLTWFVGVYGEPVAAAAVIPGDVSDDLMEWAEPIFDVDRAAPDRF